MLAQKSRLRRPGKLPVRIYSAEIMRTDAHTHRDGAEAVLHARYGHTQGGSEGYIAHSIQEERKSSRLNRAGQMIYMCLLDELYVLTCVFTE